MNTVHHQAAPALSPLVLPPLFVLLMTQVQIFPEEHALREHFGNDYERYCREVGRWLGRRQKT